MTSPTTNHLLHLLGDIERAVVFLAANPARREIGSQARNPNRPGSQEPISLDVVDAKREIPDAIGEIADRVYRERIISGAAQHGDGTEDSAFTFLRVRAAWIVGQPWAPEIFDQLLDLRSQVARLPGSPLFREVVERMPCEHCDTGQVLTRLRQIGQRLEWSSRCETCGTSYNDKALQAAKAAQLDKLEWVTATAARDAMKAAGTPVTKPQVRGWGTRGVVRRRRDETDDCAEWEYLLSDVQVKAERAHRWALARAAKRERVA